MNKKLLIFIVALFLFSSFNGKDKKERYFFVGYMYQNPDGNIAINCLWLTKNSKEYLTHTDAVNACKQANPQDSSLCKFSILSVTEIENLKDFTVSQK